MTTAKQLLMKPYKEGTNPEDIILAGDEILKLMEEYAQIKVSEKKSVCFNSESNSNVHEYVSSVAYKGAKVCVKCGHYK